MTEIKRIGILSTAKIFAMLYILAVFMCMPSVWRFAGSILAGLFGTLILFIGFPLVGFVIGVLFALLYNWGAKTFGGLKIELEPEHKQAAEKTNSQS